MEQLDDLLEGVDVTLSDDLLDRIERSSRGTNVGAPDQSAYLPPALHSAALRRRLPADEAWPRRDTQEGLGRPVHVA